MRDDVIDPACGTGDLDRDTASSHRAAVTPAPRPAALGHPLTHLWLLRRMAMAQGIDLAAAQAEGVLTQTDWAAMVTRCRGCADAEGCARLLDRAAASPDGACPPPPSCANRTVLAGLMPHRVTSSGFTAEGGV